MDLSGHLSPQPPPPLAPGDRVGVAALSGPVDPQRLEAGLEALEALGYRVVQGANLRRRAGLFAGDDGERLEAFHQLAADRRLKAIFFARGGHGVLRLLPGIDWPLLARNPRAYIGYSDLTPFLLEVVRRVGLVAFHGPMVAADLARGLSQAERHSLRAALEGRWPLCYRIRGARHAAPCEGPLLGGCLSLLTATLGTPFAPRLAGAMLFIEDVGEPPYRLDRMLTHLRLSGNLGEIQGLVIGHLEGSQAGEMPANAAPDSSDSRPVFEPPERCESASFKRLLDDLVCRLEQPVIWGLGAGHRCPNYTLPLGMPARFEPADSRLVIEPREMDCGEDSADGRCGARGVS